MSPLELRYRRLLAWYPSDHRARHEDEMIGVLLQAAAPGQTKPGPRDTFDLLLAGLWLHVRRAFGSGSSEAWRSAGAAVGAIGSCLMLTYAVAFVLSYLVLSKGSPGVPWQVLTGLGLAFLTVLAGLANLRWLAAGAGWGLLAIQGVVLGQSILALVTALALTLTAAPHAGHAWLWHRRPMLLTGGFAVALGIIPWWPPHLAEVDPRLPLLVVASTAMALAFRTPIGRRVAALLALPYLVFLVEAVDQVLLVRGWLAGMLVILVSAAVVVALIAQVVREAPKVPA